MDSFLDSIKHSVVEGLKKHSVVEGLKNLALEALHLNDHHQQEDNNADDPRPRPPAAVSPHSAAPSRSDWRHESAAGGGSNSWDSAGIQEPEARYESWNHGPGGGGAVQESHPERRRPPAAADSWAQVVGEECEEDGSSNKWQQQNPASWNQDSNSVWSSTEEALQQHLHPHSYPDGQQQQHFKQHASHQQYAMHVSTDVEPTQEELCDFSSACRRLWDLDLNRLTPGQDYELDCGEEQKVYYHREDMSGGSSLFRFLHQEVFKRPTYARFYALLDNYHADEDIEEQLTAADEHEQVAFIEEISRTAPIKYVRKYLAEKNILTESEEEFKRQLQNLWFRFYNREGTRDSSSAFEHVFVGEIKQQAEVSGFHNWIQFYAEEAKGTVKYLGYTLPRRHGESPNSHTQLLTVEFEWKGVRKDKSSTLIGVSPEFELALYTLCFFAGQEDNYLQLGPYRVNIKCYRFGQDKIGSVFPIALD
ncbi:hypothetical protein BDL97_15G012400 [Sphagnum fallax]|nr:hypothetical protein BDL97_15G012400 [Sphagnum fallax]